MNLTIIVFLSFGLAMDAFAVSLSNGMCFRGTPVWKTALLSGGYFGLFQGIMPVIGYVAGAYFADVLQQIDHWIALVLLSLIGGKMIVEALSSKGDEDKSVNCSHKTLLTQAVATSIDALAVGVSLAVTGANILSAAATIMIITCLCCIAGVFIGNRFGLLLRGKSEILGGVILVLIGINIFGEHMGWF